MTKDIFYFLFSHTDLLAYCFIVLTQAETSCLISLPLTLLVFLWASLTYPRPPKCFWVILIAYTQIAVVIKTLSQFFVISWKSNRSYMEFLGTDKQTNFAVYELILLMIIFFHRAVLKIFGLWTSEAKYEFREGNFQIDQSDPKTERLIRKSLNVENLPGDLDDLESFDNFEGHKSFDELIVEQEKARKRVFVRHELVTEYGDEDQVIIRAVYKNQNELLVAHEETFRDNKGEYVVEVNQDNVQLNLRVIDTTDTVKVYPVTRLVAVENTIEEPLDFFPKVSMFSLKMQFFITRNFLDLMKPRRDFERKRTDLYKYMFFCEFINFLILLFGFTEFVVSIEA